MATAWHKRRDLPWCKVWVSWWQSPSHVDLDAVTLGIGLRMLSLANQRGRAEDGAGWVVGGAGRPLSVAAIAREAHATTEQVNAAIAALEDVGTVVRRGDGAVGFPALQRFQESADAARKRQARADSPRTSSRRPRGDRSQSGPAQPRAHGHPPLQSPLAMGPTLGSADIPTDSPPDIPTDSPPQTLDVRSTPPKAPQGGRRSKPPKAKGPRAAWFLEQARRAGRLDDVARVVVAYQRHHPRSNPGEIERGLVAERLLGDEPPFTAGQLVEAVDGCHVPGGWHLDNGRTALELIVRDGAKVESFRRALEAHGTRAPARGAIDFEWVEPATDDGAEVHELPRAVGAEP